MDNTVLVMNLKDMLNKMQMQLNILFKLKTRGSDEPVSLT